MQKILHWLQVHLKRFVYSLKDFIKFGHYVTVAKKLDGGYGCFDDQRVTNVNFEKFRKTTTNAYILMYEQNSNSSEKASTEFEKIENE